MIIEIEHATGAVTPPPSAVDAEITYAEGDGFRIIPPVVTMEANVTIFLNETEGHRFNEYHASDELRRAWDGEIRFDACADDNERLNRVYEIFNLNHPAGYTDRSLSMADVVVLDGARRYSVERFGFKRLSDFAIPPGVAVILAWKKDHGGTIQDFFSAHHTCGRCRGFGVCVPFFADSHTAQAVCQQCGGSGAWHDAPLYTIVPRSDVGDDLAALLRNLSSYETGAVKMAGYLAGLLERIGLREHEHARALSLVAELIADAEYIAADRIARGHILKPAPAWIDELVCPTCLEIGVECDCPCPRCVASGTTCPDCMASLIEQAERAAGWDQQPVSEGDASARSVKPPHGHGARARRTPQRHPD